ncbi:hypothetical protein, variant 1 [Cryptococcus amylolentus CBS 6039]|nr:hypothetical protein, variant 1 [Cryptococcus amylolentus CBS 6039]ODN74815.1 hypothetical protein, variant 1 [Cryptococcus amylolentus CBS 6039]
MSTFSNSMSPPQRRAHATSRASNVGLACSLCRSRKVRCDGKLPACQRCVKDGQDCEYATERARRPLKDQIQNLRQRVADLESQLDASRRSSISVDPQGVREEPDESRPIIMATGSMSLNAEGNLVHAGSSSTFFWFMKKRAMENLPQAHPPTLSYLFPPHLPVTLSPSMHDRLINLAFQSQLEFGRIVDQTLFRADLEENHNSRTPSYSRFLHLIILGHGCRYIDDLQPSLSIDGTYENRGDIFISAAKALVAAEMEAPCLSSIPAFALLAIYVGNMRQDHLAFTYQGIAVVMAEEFLLDQRVSDHVVTMSDSDRRLERYRQMTYWVLSVVSSWHFCVFGRVHHWPGPVQHIEIPFKGSSLQVDPISLVDLAFKYHCRLSKIAGRIVSQIYNRADDRRQYLVKLDQELVTWCAALPQQLKPDGFASNPVPHVVAHWAFICVHTIILHRPFFISLGDHASSDLSMDRCVTAASDILWLMRLSAVYGEARNCSAFY